jgi:hypothetical protein
MRSERLKSFSRSRKRSTSPRHAELLKKLGGDDWDKKRRSVNRAFYSLLPLLPPRDIITILEKLGIPVQAAFELRQ